MQRVRELQQERANELAQRAAEERKKKDEQERKRKNSVAQLNPNHKTGGGRTLGGSSSSSQRTSTTDRGGYNPMQPWTAGTSGYRYVMMMMMRFSVFNLCVFVTVFIFFVCGILMDACRVRALVLGFPLPLSLSLSP